MQERKKKQASENIIQAAILIYVLELAPAMEVK
jgi:hypothetical protein